AEDGIRDKLVTGVQTCALPIYVGQQVAVDLLQLVHVTDQIIGMLLLAQDEAQEELYRVDVLRNEVVVLVDQPLDLIDLGEPLERSEERRVGKECRSGWSASP